MGLIDRTLVSLYDYFTFLSGCYVIIMVLFWASERANEDDNNKTRIREKDVEGVDIGEFTTSSILP